MTADPTYPLYPVVSISCAAGLLAVLATSVARRRFNFGVSLLCFFLFWETLTYGINSILWSNNADLKAFVYCDIVSHLQIFTFVLKPACTLIITRQLYNIAVRSAVNGRSTRQRRWDYIYEISVGLILPALITGPAYYTIQTARFTLVEGFGCVDALSTTGMSILLLHSWPIVLPLISVIFYCPIIVIFFYERRKGRKSSTDSDESSRPHDWRILSIGCIDIFLSLPFGIANLVLRIVASQKFVGKIEFYAGWKATHAHWAVTPIPYSLIRLGGALELFSFYFSPWASAILGWSIVILFGLSPDARALYSRAASVAASKLGWRYTPSRSSRESLSAISFRGRDVETGASEGEYVAARAVRLLSGSQPSRDDSRTSKQDHSSSSEAAFVDETAKAAHHHAVALVDILDSQSYILKQGDPTT